MLTLNIHVYLTSNSLDDGLSMSLTGLGNHHPFNYDAQHCSPAGLRTDTSILASVHQ